ncbi:MAG: hypothetical protein ABI348_02920 [Nitrososphaera sp.]
MATERPALARQASPEGPRVRAYFLLCNSCLWCASRLGPAGIIERCPVCGAAVEAIPILPNEAYRMKKTDDSGVELDFTLVA